MLFHRSESGVAHAYAHPGAFVVAAECISNDMHITVQKIITIQEPVTEMGVVRCHAGNLWFHATDCSALQGEPLHIQTHVAAGTNVTYHIHKGGMLLSSLTVVRGNVPRNLTVTGEQVDDLGPGCHQLILRASNTVTAPGASAVLQVCVLEKAAGLQASVLTEGTDCVDSADITVGVFLEKGAPALLLFSLTADKNSSYRETRKMNTRKEVFHIKHQMEGVIRVKLKAWNVFSFVEAEVFSPSGLKSATKSVCHKQLSLTKRPRNIHVRAVRSANNIIAHPSDTVTSNTTITLSIKDSSNLNDKNKQYQWSCADSCKCPSENGLTYSITPNCLPNPYQFNKYYFSVISKSNNNVQSSICILYAPQPFTPSWLSLTCTQGCNPIQQNTNAVLKLDCNGNSQCSNIVWNIEEPNYKNWPEGETMSCYQQAQMRPLLQKQNGGNQFTVNYTDLSTARSSNRDLIVAIYTLDVKPIYTTYTIKTSSHTNSPHPTPVPTKATTKPGTSATKTTTTGSTASHKPTSATTSYRTSSNLHLSCTISPPNGTTLDAFNISCSTNLPCSNCRYCFKVKNNQPSCGNNNVVNSVFLPLGDESNNYNLIITATATQGGFVVSTTITTQVNDVKIASAGDLKASVEGVLSQLKDQGQLSGVTVGQLFSSMASQLNAPSSDSTAAGGQQLREQMLELMINTVNAVPADAPGELQAIAGGLYAVTQQSMELSPSAQEQASLLFMNLSSSLRRMKLNQSEDTPSEIGAAASAIMQGAGNILDYSSSKNISDVLLEALDNIQSALLIFQNVNEAPTIIQQANIAIYVKRVTPDLLTEPISIPDCSCPAFTLPVLPSSLFPSQDPVDIRMLSLKNNPFSWNGNGNISGSIGGLTLTTAQNSRIPVENLTEDIEILLPRPDGEQVNITILNLGNYSTTAIDVPSADHTLVLKMEPSVDPLPFKLLLGYMSYPTDTNMVAATQMPLAGATLEERYTWLLDPKVLNGNIGTYYVVVRPIVGPGIKSINATLSITSISASCKFWNDSASEWATYGCRVGVNTTPSVTQCLCTHLTFFGSSFFVAPNLVDPSQTAQLFATFAQNPVVVCFVGALFVAYFLVVVWARRKDIKDKAKVKLTILEDNDPMDEYRYLLTVCTGHRRGASTSSRVTITLLGSEGHSEPHHLIDKEKRVFERGATDTFLLTAPFSLGELHSIRLWHNNSGRRPAWFVGNVMVQDLQTAQKWFFLCNSWLAIDIGSCSLDKVFPASTEKDLKSFSNLFFSKATRDFNDGHLWYSVMSRPPSSTFTCVQRVSCCFSLLLCTMLTSIMFYGIPNDPSEQVMTMGQFSFTWQQFMIGIESSLIMFPVNLIIVTIFRLSRPRELTCCACRREKPGAHELKTAVTLDNLIKDITRIAHLLSQNAKSNVPRQLAPGQQVDITDVLSVVEDFIKQNHKIGETTQSDTKGFSPSVQPPSLESSDDVHAGPAVESIEKKSNKSQYLYRQLCHVHEELSLLGPSGFPSPHSYSRALQQVQRMKGSLEDQLFTSNSVNINELTQKRLTPADSSDGTDSSLQKKGCWLPWWFVFVGWLLVFATSVVAGFFTMLYGLKFGKERSISWLVSMNISFFQSILVIQPIKVLCLAVFFALVIKKVDEEELENVAHLRNNKYTGDFNEQQAVRRNPNLYEPPLFADIEKMKKNKILEQKAFALFREIFIYMLFLTALLMVAYTQRDPNAFYLNQHIMTSFSENTSSCMSLEDVYTWANTNLLSSLFGEVPGFITGGNSKLVGNARLRQLRVKPNSCQSPGLMLQYVPDCNALYSWEAEDMDSYAPGWNRSVGNNVSTGASSPWSYQTQAQLRADYVWGSLALYRAGGFAAELGPDFENASRTLEYLFIRKWLDAFTRVIFVEFTVFNANVNLFCIVTLLLETPAIGAFQFSTQLHSVRLYQSGGLYFVSMAAAVIYLLFILYYMFLQAKLLKQQRWPYFRGKWNLLELAIILLSWGALAVFIKLALQGNQDLTYYQNHKDQFASFYNTAATDAQLQYLIAFLVLLSSIKLWHLLRLNPKMYMITAALGRAWDDISSFLVVIVVMFLAYCTASNVIYGWMLSSYQTLDKTIVTLVGMQAGIFNYDQVLDYTPLLGGLLFGSCLVLMTFVVLNLLVSVILVSFQHERIYHKPSEEEEVVDVMLRKICSLVGIRCKDSKATQESDVKSSDGLVLNNTKNIINSSLDINVHKVSDDPIKSQET
ncbi:polycystic kidney disease protein 1-like 2 [Betta splendens]|uniref:Polycystic kidney disease protein 1-like 2 n=1 Tax=Betta splendens TaxID=158456 RepID=A0A9W2XH48_BETSP|nr:polycystic kidney disease protein 1-like 2 [Betta splendens]